jgi:FMN reductase
VEIVLVSGSPSAPSRGSSLLERVADAARPLGITTSFIDVRLLPPADLMLANTSAEELVAARNLIERADGVAIATPVYKAAYSGLLKCFLDTLPVDTTLRGKVVLPIATAAAPTHVLALDYALKPVLASLGASLVCAGFWTLDSQFDKLEDGTRRLNAETAARIDPFITEFLDAVCARGA